jgi:hypothetical protein
LAKFNDLPFFAVHPSHYRRNFLRDLDRNRLHSVPVSVQQVARPDLHLADLDDAAEIEKVSEGMGN